MNEMIEVEGVSISRIEYREKPVITFRMVDELHDRPEGTARKAFHRNKDRFEEGYHFFDVSYAEWSKIPAVSLTDGYKQGNSMKFFTQAGYLMLVKPFNDERAWKVQDCLVRSYFKAKELFEEHGENLGGFKLPGKLSFSLLAKEMKGTMAMAKTYGMTEIGARHFTNEAILGQYGLDIMASMGLDNHDVDGDALSDGLLQDIVRSKIGLRTRSGAKKTLSIIDVLALGPESEFAAALHSYGLKCLKDALFIHCRTVLERLLRGTAWATQDISDILMAVPGARRSQLRLNGSPVRGVSIPMTVLQKPMVAGTEVLQ